MSSKQVCDDFPASVGFQPLERDFTDVAYPDATGGYPQAVNIVYGPSISHAWAHARGYVHCSLPKVYQALKLPAASRIITPGGHYTDTVPAEQGYSISYNVEYVVQDVITVRWNILTRGGVVTGTETAPVLIGLRYQKTCGDSHISLESGSLVASAAPGDPNTTQVEMVGWLNATTQGPSDVGGTLSDWFANLTAVLSTMSCP